MMQKGVEKVAGVKSAEHTPQLSGRFLENTKNQLSGGLAGEEVPSKSCRPSTGA